MHRFRQGIELGCLQMLFVILYAFYAMPISDFAALLSHGRG